MMGTIPNLHTAGWRGGARDKKYKKREKLMCDIFRLILRKKMNIEYKQ